MSGFQNLNDLLGAKDDQGAGPSVAPATTVTNEKFAEKMVNIKKKELETEAMRLSNDLGAPYINLDRFPVSQEALRQVPRETASALGAVCFFATPDEVRVGALDPTTPQVQQLLYDIQERNHVQGGLYLISETSLQRILEMYNTLPVIKAITKDVQISSQDLEAVQADVNDFRSLQAALEKRTTTDMLTLILGAALKLDSSDVHIEAEQSKIVVRLRLDGILHDVASLPKEVYKQLISRIKLLASLKINITDKPQDGRFTIKFTDYDIDLRISTIPTVYGESVVMRLLKQRQEGISLDKLGMRGRMLDLLKREVARPNGMIIATGPTGSGKTTTLYAILKILNQPGVKILTLEDPVEYRIEGVNQSQIDRSKDYTFAKGLRSMLRQDPDIVMVGEIRDLETADIAVQAALTGHLMLSTIHTNSAAGAIPRFLSMGVKPFLLAPALNCVIGQRLVRRVCAQCAVKTDLTALPTELQTRVNEVLQNLPDVEKKDIAEKPKIFYTAKGCAACNNLGYKGRVNICELFGLTPEIEQAITVGTVSEYEVEQMARHNGMVTMVEDGILKCLDGITTPEEVFRVIE